MQPGTELYVKSWCQRRSSEFEDRAPRFASLNAKATQFRQLQNQNPSKPQISSPSSCQHLEIPSTWQKIREEHFDTRSYDPHVGERVGEATNPGPASRPLEEITSFSIATLNPTAINGKTHLLAEMGYDAYMLSETSATTWVQHNATNQLRCHGFHSVWGTPAAPHREGTADILTSHCIRGQAIGVSIHTTCPLMASRQDDDDEWYQSGRLVRGYVQIGNITLQLITLYGIAKGQQAARKRTDSLLKRAFALALQTTMPTIIGGDINHDPLDLDSWKVAQANGWRTTNQLHRELHGFEQPATYQQSTTPDVLLIAPSVVSWVTKVEVDQSGWVSNHHPLAIRLKLPDKPPCKQTWRLPKSWIPYEPSEQFFASSYAANPCPRFTPQELQDGPSRAFRLWSEHVEAAVDQAIRLEHRYNREYQPFSHLPPAAKGRCQLPKVILTPFQKPIKPGWKGQFTPDVDVGTMHLRQKVRQLRRVQSLKFRLQKHVNPNHRTLALQLQLYGEWQAIRMAAGFPGGFDTWMREKPELFPPSDVVPDASQMYDLEQLLLFEVQHQTYSERKKNPKSSPHGWIATMDTFRDRFEEFENHQLECFPRFNKAIRPQPLRFTMMVQDL